MDTHTLTSTLELPLPIEDVFVFFSEAENLGRITPPEMKFTIISPRPIDLREGCLIDYSLGLFGVRLGWRTLISRWDPPRSFVDEQLKGPYTLWHHEHTFELRGAATLIRDTVTYALPFAPFSDLVLPLIRLQLRRIFTFRQKAVMRAFGVDERACAWQVQV